MAKGVTFHSVLQDWVMRLPLMQQAVLCSALRGPDGLPKNTPVKLVLRYLRGMVLNPARPEFIAKGREDVFMVSNPDYYDPAHVDNGFVVDGERYSRFQAMSMEFLSDLDQYPIHFVMHLAHAAEIIGYKYTYRTDKRDIIMVSSENM